MKPNSPLANPSLLDEINRAGMADNRAEMIARRMLLGSMLAGVRGLAITRSAGASTDILDLSSVGGAGVVYPPAAPGQGNINVQACGTGMTAGEQYRMGGILSVAVPTAGLTIAGADGNGDVVITPKPGYEGKVRFAMYTPSQNEANVLTRRLTVIDLGTEFPIKEALLRIATTNGATIAGTETGTSTVATLNADTTFSKYMLATASGTGASEVRAQVAASRGSFPNATQKTCGLSYYGTQLFFPSTLQTALLDYMPGPSADMLDTGFYAPQVR